MLSKANSDPWGPRLTETSKDRVGYKDQSSGEISEGWSLFSKRPSIEKVDPKLGDPAEKRPQLTQENSSSERAHSPRDGVEWSFLVNMLDDSKTLDTTIIGGDCHQKILMGDGQVPLLNLGLNQARIEPPTQQYRRLPESHNQRSPVGLRKQRQKARLNTRQKARLGRYQRPG